jgi:predicted dehydrogenase
MTDRAPMGVGIIGCGNIAGPYVADLMTHPELRLIGFADLDPARAASMAGTQGGRAYASAEALLDDPEVDIVVNLTVHHAHHAVSRAALEAGRHVFSEKPLALTLPDARDLVALAADRGLRLGCAPVALLGELAQSAWLRLRDVLIGDVRLAYAEVNWGRPETWHPAPQPFYRVGPLVDVGVYPLTLLTAMLGPARRVTGHGRVLLPERRTVDGTPFTVDSDDFMLLVVELESGVLVRMTANFYASNRTRGRGIEIHGDEGSLWISSWADFAGELEHAPFGEDYRPLRLVREPSAPMRWGAGVAEMADAIAAGRPHRLGGEHAAHVVEILAAAAESTVTGRPVDVGSSFPPPEPLGWAR